MELRDFITQTLIQIAEGVHAAQEPAEKVGAFINPIDTLSAGIMGGKTYAPSAQVRGQGIFRRPVQFIEFNVAVVVSSDVQIKAGGTGGVISVFSIEGGRESKSSHETTTRIKFSVPMTFTLHQPESIGAKQKRQQGR